VCRLLLRTAGVLSDTGVPASRIVFKVSCTTRGKDWLLKGGSAAPDRRVQTSPRQLESSVE